MPLSTPAIQAWLPRKKLIEEILIRKEVEKGALLLNEGR